MSAAVDTVTVPAEEHARYKRFRVYYEEQATKHGWKPEDGEDAVQFLMRLAYNAGWDDAKKKPGD